MAGRRNPYMYEDDEVEGFDASDYAQHVGSGAVTGLSAGSAFGPWGAFIGAVGGGVIGGIESQSAEKAYMDAQRQQNELNRDLQSRDVYERMLQSQAMQDSLSREGMNADLAAAAARGGLTPAAALGLQMDAQRDVGIQSSMARPGMFLAAQQADYARRQQVLNEYQTAQALANNAGPSDLSQAFGTAAQGVALAGQAYQMSQASDKATAARQTSNEQAMAQQKQFNDQYLAGQQADRDLQREFMTQQLAASTTEVPAQPAPVAAPPAVSPPPTLFQGSGDYIYQTMPDGSYKILQGKAPKTGSIVSQQNNSVAWAAIRKEDPASAMMSATPAPAPAAAATAGAAVPAQNAPQTPVAAPVGGAAGGSPAMAPLPAPTPPKGAAGQLPASAAPAPAGAVMATSPGLQTYTGKMAPGMASRMAMNIANQGTPGSPASTSGASAAPATPNTTSAGNPIVVAPPEAPRPAKPVASVEEAKALDPEENLTFLDRVFSPAKAADLRAAGPAIKGSQLNEVFGATPQQGTNPMGPGFNPLVPVVQQGGDALQEAMAPVMQMDEVYLPSPVLTDAATMAPKEGAGFGAAPAPTYGQWADQQLAAGVPADQITIDNFYRYAYSR